MAPARSLPVNTLRFWVVAVSAATALVTAAPIPALFQSVNAAGYSVTYASPPPFDTVNSPEFFTASRQGFDATGTATTISENLLLTGRMLQVYPNNASLTADEVALSDWIYSTDTIPSVTNNSTAASPKPVAIWAMRDRKVIGNSLRLEVVVDHRNAAGGETIACAEFTVTDGTTTLTQKVSASSVSGQTGDKNAVIVYRAVIDTTSLADESDITANCKLYPRLGDASSVNDSSAEAVIWRFSPRYFRKRLANPFYVYVSGTGNDGTGVVSTTAATARATPCATIIGAVLRLVAINSNVDYGVIRVMDDATHVFGTTGSPTKKQTHSELVIEADPLAATVPRIEYGASTSAQPNLESLTGTETWMTFRNVTVAKMGASTFARTVDNFIIRFENCTLDLTVNNSISSTPGTIKYMAEGLTVINGSSCNLLSIDTGGGPRWRLMRGVEMSSVGNLSTYAIIGCNLTLVSGAGLNVSTGQLYDGAIVAFNQFRNIRSTLLNLTSDVTGFVLSQNLFEVTNGSIDRSIRISSDSASNDTTHVILRHNTFMGFYSNGRNNIFYDDDANPANARTHTLFCCTGNLHCQINVKGGEFDSVVGRNGHRAYRNGVGCAGEFAQFRDADPGGSFAQKIPGWGAKIGTSTTVRQNPGWTDYEGPTASGVDGAGGGDYTLQPGAAAKAMVPVVALKYDLAGNPRSTTLASAGAYE